MSELAHLSLAEAAIQVGNWQGSLHGMPIGLKDSIDVRGIPITGHPCPLPSRGPRPRKSLGTQP